MKERCLRRWCNGKRDRNDDRWFSQFCRPCRESVIRVMTKLVDDPEVRCDLREKYKRLLDSEWIDP